MQKLEEKPRIKVKTIGQFAQRAIQAQRTPALSERPQTQRKEGLQRSPKARLARKLTLSAKSTQKVSYLKPIKGVGSRRERHTESQSSLLKRSKPIPQRKSSIFSHSSLSFLQSSNPFFHPHEPLKCKVSHGYERLNPLCWEPDS